MATSDPGVTVDDVIVHAVPAGQAGLLPEERQALLTLSEAVAQDPAAAPHQLVQTALALTGAGSAGISLEDMEGGHEVFRWIAVTGEFRRYLHGTMPRHFSPCGTVLERGSTLVMRDPARYFNYVRNLQTPITSALLVPFGRHGRLVGTVWVLSHEEDKLFTTEDVRVVENLTKFSTTILDAVEARGARQAPE